MRFTNKYKYLNTNLKFLLFLRVKKKILFFKRPKWNFIQLKFKNITKSLKTRGFFIGFKKCYKISKNCKYFSSLPLHYKTSLVKRKSFFFMFDRGVSAATLKKLLFKQKTENYLLKASFCFMNPLFCLRALLYKLSFFKTSFILLQYLNSGKILVNKKKIFKNYILKEGDIVSFSPDLYKHINLNQRIHVLIQNFSNFLEFDYYTHSIILIKSPEDISAADQIYLYNARLEVKDLIDLFIKKM